MMFFTGPGSSKVVVSAVVAVGAVFVGTKKVCLYDVSEEIAAGAGMLGIELALQILQHW